MKKIAILIILIAQFSLSACGKKQGGTDSHATIIKSYQLIDEDRNDEAIELLEAAIKKDPEHYEYRSVLASAYAHKGGFKIQKFIPAMNRASDMKTVITSLKKGIAANKANPSADKMSDISLSVAHLLVVNANFFRIYQEIPILDQAAVIYIKYAIEVLDGLKEKIKPEDALYRSILRILVFKYTFSENMMGEFNQVADQAKNSCSLDLVRVNDHVIDLSRILIEILRDLSISHPKKAEKYSAMSKEIADITTEVSIGFTAISILDEASQLFLKQLAIQNELGKLIKCK